MKQIARAVKGTACFAAGEDDPIASRVILLPVLVCAGSPNLPALHCRANALGDFSTDIPLQYSLAGTGA